MSNLDKFAFETDILAMNENHAREGLIYKALQKLQEIQPEVLKESIVSFKRIDERQFRGRIEFYLTNTGRMADEAQRQQEHNFIRNNQMRCDMMHIIECFEKPDSALSDPETDPDEYAKELAKVNQKYMEDPKYHGLIRALESAAIHYLGGKER
jgi:hypothetical protein